VTVSAKKLFEIIKELPESEITFKAKENCWIEIRCGKALFNVVGISPEEFPYFPGKPKDKYLSMNGSQLKEMLESTFSSVSNDESKYNLNGIYFKAVNDTNSTQLRLVATDGHRLSLIDRSMPIDNVEELKKGIIFPKKGILELKKISEEGDGNLNLSFMDNNAIVVKNKLMMVMRLVDGEFPDYTRVIPKNNENFATISRDPFFHALKRISILSSEKSRGVKIILKDGTLELSSSNPDYGDAREDLDIEYSGPEIIVGFNARFLIDILQSISDEKIRFFIKDNISPGMIRPEGREDFLAVVMPMRL
jgi:DNA polymerase III subunit beta